MFYPSIAWYLIIQVINKSTLVLDIKPQRLEIDLDAVEKAVREIKIEGLDWGQVSKRVPIAYGLHKLQMGATIVDDLVATDDIIEKIECLGMNEEQILAYQRTRATGDDDVEHTGEGGEEEEEEEPGWVQSVEIVSFQKLWYPPNSLLILVTVLIWDDLDIPYDGSNICCLWYPDKNIHEDNGIS